MIDIDLFTTQKKNHIGMPYDDVNFDFKPVDLVGMSGIQWARFVHVAFRETSSGG